MIDSYHDRRTGYEFMRQSRRREARLLRLQRQQRRRDLGRRLGCRDQSRFTRLGRRVPDSVQPDALQQQGRAHFRLHGRSRCRAHRCSASAGRSTTATSRDTSRSRASSAAFAGYRTAAPARGNAVRRDEERDAPVRAARSTIRSRSQREPTSSTACRRTSRSTPRSTPISVRWRPIRRC